MVDTGCFHCGEPVTRRDWPVRVAGREEQTCCPGCQAACNTIVSLGLENYYLHRDRYAPRGDDAPVPEDLFANFGDEALAESGFVITDADDLRECTLVVDDLRCAACGWLIEKSLKAMPGVEDAAVNITSGRIRVRWVAGQQQVRDFLLRIRRLGYRVLPFRGTDGGSRLDAERRSSLLRMVVAAFGMMQVMHVAVGFYGEAAGSMSIAQRDYLRAISFLVTTPVLFYSGWPFLRNAWFSIRGGVPGMDVPVAVALVLAYFASVWAVIVEGPEVWFDSVVMFVFFLAVGRHLELEARRKATRVIDNLSAALPMTATRVRDGRDEVIPAARLVAGDVVRVRPGDHLPADGVILSGEAHVNEAMLTGESRPERRGPGDAVTGGCINVDGVLEVRVTAPPAQGRLSRIVDLVTRAQSGKPRLQELADHIATHFVVWLLLLTAATWLAWHFIDPSRAFWIALAVLVVSCPCALSLATPAAYTVGTNLLTGRGLLVGRAHVLSSLPDIRAVVFDKTGTLTLGQPTIRELVLAPGQDDREARRLAALLECDSEHPLARAFTDVTTVPAARATDVRVHPGRGLEGTVDGRRLRIGSAGFVTDGAFAPGAVLPVVPAGGTWVWLGGAEGVIAGFQVTDSPRPEAAAVVRDLAARGLAVHLLSGDASDEATRLAADLAIPTVRAGATPEDKVAYVQALRSAVGPVLMIGDGVNDAPVLAAADVSMAMGEGTDLARNAADAVLLRADLRLVPQALDAALATRRTVHQNLAWALGYNLSMIPIAVMGWVPPWLASLGMSASSLIVVGNALFLERRVPARQPPSASSFSSHPDATPGG